MITPQNEDSENRFPTLRSLFDELMFQRRGEGIGQSKVAEHAKELQRLPVIEMEMRRAKHRDRAVATYVTIVAAAGNSEFIPNIEWRMIVDGTMNIGIVNLDLDWDEKKRLDCRQEAIADLLGVSRHTFEKGERRAFTEFASSLFRATESPWRDSARAVGR